jgi:hypothetical protein
MVDGAHVEVPAAAAKVSGGLERNPAADGPPEPLRELCTDDAALAVGEEGGPLRRGNHVLGVHAPPVLGFNDELREEVLRVLVDAAEPRRVRRIAHPGEALQARQIGGRERLHDRRAADHDEPVRPCHIDSLPEPVVDGTQYSEEEHRDRKRSDRQDRPDLPAAQVGDEQREELHPVTSGCIVSRKRAAAACV